MGDAAFAPKNEGPNVHTKSVAAQAKRGRCSGNKKGGTHMLQRTNILTGGPRHHLAVNTRMRCLVRQRSLGSFKFQRRASSTRGLCDKNYRPTNFDSGPTILDDGPPSGLECFRLGA
jgi:hypothetical protein